MDAEASLRRAMKFFQEAYRRQMDGDLEKAIELYSHSIDIYPTAEAHTFLGWAYSFLGRLDEAICQCKIAIEIDPDFGNPYNDIGVYLMHQGQIDAAVPWLEKAITAPRYEARCFPHLNLGRILERKGKWSEALAEYKQASEENPDYQLATDALKDLQGRMN